MLGGSPWTLTMPDGLVMDVDDAWIFTIMWGEWHPITDLSGDIMLDERHQYEVLLTPTSVRPAMELLFDKREISLRDLSASDRLYVKTMPQGVSHLVLAIDGMRQGLGFESDQVIWYNERTPANPLGTYYCGIYCFMGDQNQRGEKENLDSPAGERTVKSGWAFYEPSDDFPCLATEPGNGRIKPPPELSFVILNGRYGALRGSGRELYFPEETTSTFRDEVRAKFEFDPGDGSLVKEIKLMKQGHDVTLSLKES
jgi:hypothetical protein